MAKRSGPNIFSSIRIRFAKCKHSGSNEWSKKGTHDKTTQFVTTAGRRQRRGQDFWFGSA
ncbi:hypothetical protein EXN66_Car012167 [Channa argus]|uniref:Uncharacterized protein n=1 Tax=Channa argus TaxID=215402 RepID=A0A6G1Q1Z8_CHAAH|nr:hypothetical protein EXN66_Car012167 [Channa argus]